jgi:hypothetical protein
MADSPSLVLAKSYRKKAEQLRTYAATLSFPDIREQLEKIGSRYDAMADTIERGFPVRSVE